MLSSYIILMGQCAVYVDNNIILSAETLSLYMKYVGWVQLTHVIWGFGSIGWPMSMVILWLKGLL